MQIKPMVQYTPWALDREVCMWFSIHSCWKKELEAYRCYVCMIDLKNSPTGSGAVFVHL